MDQDNSVKSLTKQKWVKLLIVGGRNTNGGGTPRDKGRRNTGGGRNFILFGLGRALFTRREM